MTARNAPAEATASLSSSDKAIAAADRMRRNFNASWRSDPALVSSLPNTSWVAGVPETRVVVVWQTVPGSELIQPAWRTSQTR